MIPLAETIYPYLTCNLSATELYEYYYILPGETDLLAIHTKKGISRLCFLVLLKTFKHLGYFMQVKECPKEIISYLSRISNIEIKEEYIYYYDKSSIKFTHIQAIRKFFGTRLADKNILETLAINAAKENNNLIAIANEIINKLKKSSYELPAFSSLSRLASRSKAKVNHRYYSMISDLLTQKEKTKIEKIFKTSTSNSSNWNKIKWEPKNFSHNNALDLINHFEWIKSLKVRPIVLTSIPKVKLNFFFDEAIAMDLQTVRKLKDCKQLTYAAIIINARISKIKDDMCQVLMHIMGDIENEAKAKLCEYKISRTQQAEQLIDVLKEILLACKNKRNNNTKMKRINQVLDGNILNLINKCNDYNSHKGNHYFPFMKRKYKLRRKILFKILSELDLSSSTKDKTILQSISLMVKHKDVGYDDNQFTACNGIDLSWIAGRWHNFIFPDDDEFKINKDYFEICLFAKIAEELKSRDLVDKGANSFGDFNSKLISKEYQKKQFKTYAEKVNISNKENKIIDDLKVMLQSACRSLNSKINNTDSVRIKSKKIILKKIKADEPAKNLALIQQELNKRTPKINILEIILEMSKILGITKFFGPPSGTRINSEEYLKHLVITLFSFGCNVGASETASIITGITRKQIGRINLHHITEDSLDKCICHVVNLYNQFMLPKYWGTGEHAAVDGTHWATYLKNLFSSYHFRYCEQGAIAYYHVSDTYTSFGKICDTFYENHDI